MRQLNYSAIISLALQEKEGEKEIWVYPVQTAAKERKVMQIIVSTINNSLNIIHTKKYCSSWTVVKLSTSKEINIFSFHFSVFCMQQRGVKMKICLLKNSLALKKARIKSPSRLFIQLPRRPFIKLPSRQFNYKQYSQSL